MKADRDKETLKDLPRLCDRTVHSVLQSDTTTHSITVQHVATADDNGRLTADSHS